MNRQVYLVDGWLKHATELLEKSQVSSSRLDALILLEDALGKDRSYLLAHPETELGAQTYVKLEKQLVRRGTHEPLAYIRGRAELYGRTFLVTKDTLQPRPETETIITLLKNLKLPELPCIADIGTGSGAIAITAKLELPHSIVHATEIQSNALTVAQKNAKVLEARVDFKEGNLIEPLVDNRLDVILANLPYVPNDHTINKAAMQEPAIAIFGGEDGLDLYREMFEQIQARTQRPQYILAESLPTQHLELAKIADSYGYKMIMNEDFIQVFELSAKSSSD